MPTRRTFATSLAAATAGALLFGPRVLAQGPAGRRREISIGRKRVRVIDAHGLVVAPGFIDLHSHGTTNAANEFQAHDGVCADVAWHPLDGSRVATAGWDGVVKYWE